MFTDTFKILNPHMVTALDREDTEHLLVESSIDERNAGVRYI